jgi:hypothetical protein
VAGVEVFGRDVPPLLAIADGAALTGTAPGANDNNPGEAATDGSSVEDVIGASPLQLSGGIEEIVQIPFAMKRSYALVLVNTAGLIFDDRRQKNCEF